MKTRIRITSLLAVLLLAAFAGDASALPKPPDTAIESHSLATSPTGARAALKALAKRPQSGGGGDDANLSSALWDVPWDSHTISRAALADTRIGPLWVFMPDGSHRVCTATVVGRRTIVTAARCVRDRDSGQWARSALFMPWINGRLVPARGGYWWGVRAFTDANFTATPNWRYRAFDYAFIKMQKPIGDRSGRFRIAFNAPLSGFVRQIAYAPETCTVKSCRPHYCASQIGGSRQLYEGEWYLAGTSCGARTAQVGGSYQAYLGGRWQVTAVETFCQSSQGDGCASPGAHWGVRLGDAAHRLYDWAVAH